MTDYSELVKRLRSIPQRVKIGVFVYLSDEFPVCREAADALEAQAKRIAELTAALEPFAEVVERYAYCLPESGMPAVAEDDVIMFELMYFLQARKVLENSAADWEAQDRTLGEKKDNNLPRGKYNNPIIKKGQYFY